MKKRQLFFAERLMCEKKEGSIIMLFPFTIRGNIKEEDIRIALDKMQKKHPQLRTYVKDDCFVYPENYNPIPIRIVERTSKDTWEEETRREIETNFKIDESPLIKLAWIRSADEDVSEIVLSISHIICDGKGLLFILREFCSVLGNPEKELTPYAPIESLEALMPEVSLTKMQKLQAFGALALAKVALAVTNFNKKQPPIKHYAIYWKLDRVDTLLLNNLLEKHRVPLNCLFSVITSRAYMKYKNPGNKKRLTFLSTDIRRYVSKIRKDMLIGFAPMLKLEIDFEKNQDIWELSKIMSEEIIDKALRNTDVKRYGFTYSIQQGLFFIEYLKSIVPGLVKRNLCVDEGQDFMFITMGKINIPLKYNTFEIENIHIPKVRLPWANSNYTGYTESDGIIKFLFSSNEHCFPEENALKVKEEIINTLHEILEKEKLSIGS